MNLNTNTNCNIFAALHEAITAVDNRQLKFAKCKNCGRFTPYRLRLLKDSSLRCKKCGTHLF